MVEDRFRYGIGFALVLSIEVKGFEVADARAAVAEVGVGSGGSGASGAWRRKAVGDLRLLESFFGFC